MSITYMGIAFTTVNIPLAGFGCFILFHNDRRLILRALAQVFSSLLQLISFNHQKGRIAFLMLVPKIPLIKRVLLHRLTAACSWCPGCALMLSYVSTILLKFRNDYNQCRDFVIQSCQRYSKHYATFNILLTLKNSFIELKINIISVKNGITNSIILCYKRSNLHFLRQRLRESRTFPVNRKFV